MKPFSLCLLSLLFVSAGATEPPIVAGQVRLPDGQPVVGAQVMLVDVADLRRGALVETTTDEAGGFAMPLAGFDRLSPLDRLSPQLGRSGLPDGFVLGPNYPNPFNPATVIPYELAASAHVRLEVFNLLGQRVATLVDGYQAAGSHTAVWTATNAAGQAVSAGVYLYRLTAASTSLRQAQASRSASGASATGRMVLVDGQAGFGKTLGPVQHSASASTASWAEPVEVHPTDAAYGLVVLRAGVVSYVDADFRVAAGLAPVDVVIEEGRGKRLAGDGWDDLFALFNETVVSSNDGDGNDDGSAEAGSTAAVVDLVVDSLWVDRSELSPSESFTLWVRLRNQGADPSDSTRVGFYLSNNTTISTSDTQMGSAQVDSLAAAGTSTVSLELTAPGLGTYQYGACVEAVSGEADADNNCSAAVAITVSPVVPSADLVVAAKVSTTAPGRSNNIFSQGLSFTLSAMVSNQGTAASDSTMLYYYVSADSTISPEDAALDSVSVGSLAVADTSADSLRLFSPSEAGTYYYGACVASVGGESEMDNNCSSGVRVIVYELPTVNEATPATPLVQLEPGRFSLSLPGGASTEMEFVWIKPGKFKMGSPTTDADSRPNEKPQHEVTISKGFWLGKYEVTQGQWTAVMGTKPWSNRVRVKKNEYNPAVFISWNDVQTFISRLNAAAGSDIFRLPTEAEWEYACRAGTTTKWSFGDTESQLTNYAWYRANAWEGLQENQRYARRVGSKLPNPWGLYDMHGNVSEWVQDWCCRTYNSSSQVDPKGPSTGWQRITRGGSFRYNAEYERSAKRGARPPDDPNERIGVRLLKIR